MRYVVAAPAVYSRVKTKADLKRAVAAINAGEPNSEVDLQVSDPAGFGYGIMGVSDLVTSEDLRNIGFMVSNSKRTWYAAIERNGDKLVVR